MKPIVHGLEARYAGKIVFLDVNTDSTDGQQLARERSVDAIPSFFFIDARGQTVGSHVGGLGESALASELDKLLR